MKQKQSVNHKKKPKTSPIKVKEDPKATILKHASDDVLAMAIRDVMNKDKHADP